MRAEIKETCSCGAVLQYSEVVAESYQANAAYRQKAFHTAHESCRPKYLTKQMSEKLSNVQASPGGEELLG